MWWEQSQRLRFDRRRRIRGQCDLDQATRERGYFLHLPSAGETDERDM